MSSDSPGAELYGSNGIELSVQNATAIPANTPALIAAGSDGTNSRFIKVDSSGNIIIVGDGVAGTPAGGVVSIQGVTSGTAVTVAGTVTANQGTANTLANAWPIKVTDGTNTSAVKAASTAAVATDPSLVVAFSPNSPLPTGTNSIGTVNQGTANVLANAWSQKITDGTNGPVAVKAPNTSPVAADPALVVALSPNSVAQSSLTGSGTITALSQSVIASTAGYGTCIFNVSGTWSGTLTVQGHNGDGVWFTISALLSIGGTIVNSTTANGAVELNCAGFAQVRLTATAWTSGTANITWGSAVFNHWSYVWSNSGANFLTNSQLIDSTGNALGVTPASTAATASQEALVVGLSPNSPLPTGTNSIGTVNQGTANTLANAWSQKITDGTNGPVAVKAPSTAAVATDPALVVTLSPNSIAQSNATGSGTVAALNGNVVATAAGYGSIIFDITGTWAGTLTTQATNGDGTWINVAALSNQSGLITQSVTINGTVEMNAAGWTQARLIATAWTSGTATVTWSAGQGSHVMIAYQGNGINLQTNTALVDSNQNFLGVTLASTAATASQEALVVGLSPNSPLPTGTNSIGTVNQGTANTLANAWSQKITDGTNGPVAVKAPSTAAVATDPALVVAISPNNSLAFTTNDSTGTGTLGALNATVQLAVAGERTAGMQLVAGSLIGTIVPEISMDGGTTWVSTFFDDPITSNIMASVVFGSSNTATTKTIVGAGGSSHVRVRVSAYTSGTATCNLRAVQLDDPTVLFGGAAGSSLPPVVAQDGGSVTTSAPTYSTGTLNPLSLNTTGDLRVTGKVTDGTNTAAVKAASTAAVATDPALVVTMSPNSTELVVDRSAMTAGVQSGQPTIGQSSGVGRIPRLDRLSYTVPGDKTLLALDMVEQSTINTWLWTTSNTTMTTVQASGILTLNNNSTTTTTTDAIITSTTQFAIYSESPIECAFRALATQTTNSTIELGFGAPSGTTAIINNGAFFRIQNSGQVKCVTSYNGTETVSAVIATLTTTHYYLFLVSIDDGGSRFIIEDSGGIPIVDVYEAIPVTTPEASLTSHIPSFARVYNSGAAGAAPQLKITSFQAWRYEVNSNKPWAQQLGGAGKSSGIDPITFAQTGQIFTTAPSAAVLTSSGVNYTTLGGDFDIGQAGGGETQYGIFGYQVPSPYSLYITELYMPQPFVTTALGGTLNIQEWSFMIANSNNPTAATGYRYSLGIFTAAVNAPIGTIYTGTPIQQTFTCPLVVQPGMYFLIICKHLYGTTTGVTRGTILVNGYFE
jgi:hypothetical protein